MGTYTTSDGLVHPAFNVERSQTEYDRKAIGVVSTKAYDVMGADILEWTDSAVEIALAGRVPVTIADTSEPIEPGDMIATSSDEPGAGMKAVDDGYVIGKALESWNPGDGIKQYLSSWITQSM